MSLEELPEELRLRKGGRKIVYNDPAHVTLRESQRRIRARKKWYAAHPNAKPAGEQQ